MKDLKQIKIRSQSYVLKSLIKRVGHTGAVFRLRPVGLIHSAALSGQGLHVADSRLNVFVKKILQRTDYQLLKDSVPQGGRNRDN